MKTIHLSSVDSTNAYLKRNYKSLENYTFVSSDNQTAGRGRNLREWKSENGKNLLFSLLFLQKPLISHYKEISIVTAYSIIQILEEIGIKDLSIKWPNDVFVKDRKICGVLLEAISNKEIECLIVGVGLNVNQKVFNGEYRVEPTSISNCINKDIDIELLKSKLYSKIIDNMKLLLNDYNFYSYICNYDYLKGKEAYASINNDNKKIRIKGINSNYSLKIEYDNKIEDIESGEISFHI